MGNIYMPSGLDTLRQEVAGCRKERFLRLIEQCRSYFGEPLPEEHPMKSITYFGMAACNLALAYRLTGQPHWLKEARRWISQGVAYPHWGRAVKVDVDLSAAWLLFGFGLCYNWLAQDLPEEERTALLEKLKLQGDRMYDYSQTSQGGCWPTNYWQNHNWIDYTGLAMAGYAIRAEYPAAQAWIDAAREDLSRVFSLLPEDGSDYEGIAYWRYGVIWLAQYAQLLREMEGEDLFSQSSFLRNTFYYRLYQTAPGLDRNFPFGDCHDKRSGHTPALYYKLASEYRLEHAQWLANEVLARIAGWEIYESGIKPGMGPEAFLEFLWYDPTVSPKSPDSLPTEIFFPDMGLLSLRSSWQADACAISFKCASGGGHKQWRLAQELEQKQGYPVRSMGHHHPDSNSLILIHANDYLLTDEGYSSQKYAAHHNLVVVDGQGYEQDGSYDVYRELDFSRTAQVEDYQRMPGFGYIRGQSAALYKKELGLTCYSRELLSMDNGYFLICDRMEAKLAHRYTQLFHCETIPFPILGGWRVENGLSRLDILPLGKQTQAEVTTTSVSANPTSQEPSLIIRREMQTLCVHSPADTKDWCFFTLLHPCFTHQKPLSVTQKWQGDRWVVVVSAETFTDHIVWIPAEREVSQRWIYTTEQEGED